MMGSPTRKIGAKNLGPLGLKRNSQTPSSGERCKKVSTRFGKKISSSIQRRMISSMELARHEADAAISVVAKPEGIRSTASSKLKALEVRIEAKLTKEEAQLRCHNVVRKADGDGDEDLFDRGDALCVVMRDLLSRLSRCAELVSAFQMHV